MICVYCFLVFVNDLDVYVIGFLFWVIIVFKLYFEVLILIYIGFLILKKVRIGLWDKMFLIVLNVFCWGFFYVNNILFLSKDLIGLLIVDILGINLVR